MLLQHRDLRKWRACLLEALVGRCQEYLVGKLGEGFPPLLARMGMGVGVNVDIMATLFSAEQFAMASAHSLPRMPA